MAQLPEIRPKGQTVEYQFMGHTQQTFVGGVVVVSAECVCGTENAHVF